MLAIASSGELGGAELSLLTFLARRPPRIEPSVLILGDGPLRERLVALGVPVLTEPGLAARPTARTAAGFAFRLRRVLRELRPQVVWAVGIKAATLSVGPCRTARTPMLWHKVDLSHDGRVARALAAASSGVVAVSEATAAGLGGDRHLLGVVGPALELDPDLVAEPDPEHPVIGSVGRLVPYKGHHLVVASAGLLLDEFPGLRVVLAGPPDPKHPEYAAQLDRAIADAGLDGRVELPGFVPVATVLRRLSVYVNATYRDERGYGLEGLGASMIEASWAGVPVVAAAGGGVEEVVVPGTTGTVVPSPEPELLADAVRAYLRDPELAARTGAAGRALVRDRFDPGKTVERVVALLDQAAN